MSSLEFEEKNVDKAVKKACKELNLNKDELRYEVLSYGSSGIFGLAGVKKARIRVNLPEKPQKSPEKIKVPVAGQPSESENSNRDVETSENALLGEDASSESGDSDDGQRYSFSELPESSFDLGRTVLQHIVDYLAPEAKISAEEGAERIPAAIRLSLSGKKVKPWKRFNPSSKKSSTNTTTMTKFGFRWMSRGTLKPARPTLKKWLFAWQKNPSESASPYHWGT